MSKKKKGIRVITLYSLCIFLIALSGYLISIFIHNINSPMYSLLYISFLLSIISAYTMVDSTEKLIKYKKSERIQKVSSLLFETEFILNKDSIIRIICNTVIIAILFSFFLFI